MPTTLWQRPICSKYTVRTLNWILQAIIGHFRGRCQHQSLSLPKTYEKLQIMPYMLVVDCTDPPRPRI